MFNNCDENAIPETLSLVTAIKSRYGDFCDRSNLDALQFPACQQRELSSLVIHIKTSDYLPGKRRASGSLELLVLNDKNISTAGDNEELSTLVRHITQLDLAKNSIACWNEVCQILNSMPLLEHCNLSYNPLHAAPFPTSSNLNLNKLNSLVLNATHVGWSCVLSFLRQIPNLEELHLSLNDYNDAHENLANEEFQSDSFTNVHVLHLNRCNLRHWSTFVKICRLFPCLETVVAAENHVDSFASQEEEIKDVFACLHSLNVKNWPIKSWDDVDKCSWFPLLSELKISNIPLLEPYSDEERRLLVIARLPDITLLNGSAVRNRESAERFFIRYYLEREDKPKRYFELVNIHGQLKKLLDVDLSPKEQAQVRLIFEDENRVELKSISLCQSVGEFKKSLQDFCGLPPSKIKLWYLDVESIGRGGMAELRYPKQMLHSLRVTDGDEFHIQAKPEFNPPRRRTSSSSSQPSPVKQ